ncbi:MAG: tripartite tricarboxylate transporter substrate binding protein [Pseudomonadota bacterium]
MNTFFASVARIAAFTGFLIFAASAAAQQAFPNKPIRFIVPYAPGGGASILARIIGQKLTESWGQQVIVDNRPGGNGAIGGEALVASPPDGHTILLVTGTHVISPLLLPTRYDPIKDFAPVATVTSYELILVLHPSVPANNLKELIALAKSKPGQLNYATAGIGNSGHLTIELFNLMAGVKMQNVPYKGSAPALIDLLGGQVQLTVVAPSSTIPHIRNGKLKAIAVSGDTRLAALPQVPTFTEAGLPGFEVKNWYGILAPATTPKPIINKYAAKIALVLAMPDTKEKIVSQGMDPYISTSDEFAKLIKADMEKWSKVIKAANIKFENY